MSTKEVNIEQEPNRWRHPLGYLGRKLKTKQGWLSLFVFFLKAGVLFSFVGIIGAVGIYYYYSQDLPRPGQISSKKVAESTKIFDRSGQVLLYEIHGEERRTIIPLNDMSPAIKNATIVAEDDQFYHHHGIDYKAIVRAVLADIKHSKSQGASTITQQFIKNAVLSSEKTYSRKIKEAILSIEIERRFNKDEILEMYLNQIPYGTNAYGIEAASQTYFEKPAASLTLDESALLAALPQATTYYSPYGNHTEQLIWRRDWIIKRMEDLGYVSDKEAIGALEADTLSKIKPFTSQIKAAHFVMYVKQNLVDEYGEDFIESGGLKIYTTLDWEMQSFAQEALKKRVEANTKNFNASNAALVAIAPETGDILSMVGSKDYFNKEDDGNVNVALRKRQPGSSFKPFAYATAFAKGYLPQTIVYDVKTNFKDEYDKDYEPQNYNGKFIGPVAMKDALAMSLNIPAVKTLYLAGLDDTIDTASAMGINTLQNRDRYGLALVLGGGEVTLLEETSAFGVFANDGMRLDQKAILRIEDSSGKIIKDNSVQKGRRVLMAQVARQINEALSDNSARSPVFGSHSPLYITGKKIAAKTGTTQEYRDAWTVGYTPEIVVGVWVGNNDNSAMREGASGISAAAPLWSDYMNRFINNFSGKAFIGPEEDSIQKPMVGGFLEDKVVLRIDKESKYKATKKCSKKYTKEITFQKSHNILYYVDKENPRGKYPQDPSQDPQFKYWEKGVLKWTEENDIKDNPPEKWGCKGDQKDNEDD